MSEPKVQKTNPECQEPDSPHNPENCPDGGGCQDEECICYWQRKAERIYGNSEPWRD